MRSYKAMAASMLQVLAKCMLVACCAMALTASPSHARRRKVDHVHLAEVLLKDKHYTRVVAVLAEAQNRAQGRGKKLSGRGEYLLGVARLKLGDPQGALDALNAAEAAQTLEPPLAAKLFLHQAQAYMALDKHAQAETILQRERAQLQTEGRFWLLLAEIYRLRGALEQSFTVLDAGHTALPDDIEVQRARVLLLIQLGLHQKALKESFVLLEKDSSMRHAEALADGFAGAEAFAAAGEVLEWARLRHPNHMGFALRLAHSQARQSNLRAASDLLAEAARQDPSHHIAAADLALRAGHYGLAMTYNGQVLDQKKKIQQRFDILVQDQRLEEAALMAPRLHRLGLLQNDDVRYAMAYALFKTGQFAEAQKHLDRVASVNLASRVAAMREALAACQNQPTTCR